MGQRRRMPVYTQTALRRVSAAIVGIAVVMIVGTEGFHLLEGMSYVNAVYFESMLATGQGPPLQLNTNAAKIFASIMAFVSVGSVITTLVFTLGPVLALIWREALERAEFEARKVGSEVKEKAEEMEKK